MNHISKANCPNSNKWIPGIILNFNEESDSKSIIRSVNDNEITAVNIANAESRTIFLSDLEDAITRGEITPMHTATQLGETSFVDLDEISQIEVVRRKKYIDAYYKAGVKRSKNCLEQITLEVAEKIGDQRVPSWNTLNNWIKLYENSQKKLKGLFPKHRCKGNRQQNLDPIIYSFIDLGKELYLSLRQPSVKTAVRHIEHKIIAHNLSNPDNALTTPSYNTIKYHIDQVSHHEKSKARQGLRFASTEYSYEHDYEKPLAVLERVEIDHTPLDIQLLHDDHKTLAGRPYLTAIIDVYSDVILGYAISYEPPSYVTVALALKHAILKKVDLKSGESWPAHGLPSLLVADNGKEFWSGDFEQLASTCGVTLQYAPVRAPRYKSKIERFFGTLNSLLIDPLPGKILPPNNKPQCYVSTKEATITVSEFQSLFSDWLINIYHRTASSISFKTPLDKWEQSELMRPIPEEDQKEITLNLLPSEKRTLRRDGMQINGLSYKNQLLTDLYKRSGNQELTVKFDPLNLGFIHVFDKFNETYLTVACKSFEYANNLTLFSHKTIKENLKSEAKNKSTNDITLLEAKARLGKLVENHHQKNKKNKTQKSSRRISRIENVAQESISGNHLIQNSPDICLISNLQLKVSANQPTNWGVL